MKIHLIYILLYTLFEKRDGMCVSRLVLFYICRYFLLILCFLMCVQNIFDLVLKFTRLSFAMLFVKSNYDIIITLRMTKESRKKYE